MDKIMNMRRITLVTASLYLTLAPSVFAASDHSDNLCNLNYYPHVGHLLATPQTSFTINDQSSTTSTNADAPAGDSNVGSSSFNLALEYGLLWDGLRIGLSENELFSSVTSHANSAGVTSLSRSSGVSDPTATLYYRYWEDDAKTHMSGDLNVALSPSFVTHNVTSSALDGSNGKGYGYVSVAAPFVGWMNIGNLLNEVGISPAAQRQFSGNGNAATISSSYNRSSQWVYTAAVSDRLHLTPELFFQPIANLNFPYTVTDTYLNTTSNVSNTHNPFYVTPSLEMGYLLMRNVLFVAEYTYNNFTTTSDSSTTKNIDDTIILRFLIEI
jgi:hypothetical protein